MRKIWLCLVALAVAVCAVADRSHAVRVVDLREPAALEQLKNSDPVQFQKIQQILLGLAERPDRITARWLQTNFDARDVELPSALLMTSYPPKQLLQFTLEETRYIMHVTRSDLDVKFAPL